MCVDFSGKNVSGKAVFVSEIDAKATRLRLVARVDIDL